MPIDRTGGGCEAGAMSVVPEGKRLLAQRAAAKLRERAAALRPDEDLQVSVAANAAVAEDFEHAYGALQDLGLKDRVLERFFIEKSTGGEMRDAAERLERLAAAEELPVVRTGRVHGPLARTAVREHRLRAIFTALVLGAVPLVFGLGFALFAIGSWERWRHDREFGPVATAVNMPRASARTPRPDSSAPLLTPPDDHVADRADVLGARARMLNDRLALYERDTSNQVLVYVDRRMPAGTTIEELGSASMRRWGVGQQGKDNGVIFFVFVDDRQMRIEVGYGLESVLTDARAKRITSQVVKPLFEQGKYAEGIEAGADEIMAVARGGEAAVAVASTPPVERASLVPVIVTAILAALCLLALVYVIRGLLLFLNGYQTLLFMVRRNRYGRSSLWSGSFGGSGSDSSSDSGGSFSGGGGDGGGGGSSDSW
jgi:uncharacterized protein